MNYIESIFADAQNIAYRPRIGMILGSGLSNLSENFDCECIPYSRIASLPKPTVSGHRGELYINNNIAICSGRFHYYEGHEPQYVVSTVALLRALGCEKLIITNAAGGINRSFVPGDIMIISDHINLLGFNPLCGAELTVGGKPLGERFPDMSCVYSAGFGRRAQEIDSGLKRGVYIAVSGPSYETPAEIMAFAGIGADAVGMSTVPEAIFARYLGMEVGGLSLITNFAAGLGSSELQHSEVMEIASQAAERMKAVVSGLVDWWLQN